MKFPEVELNDLLIEKKSYDSCLFYITSLKDEDPESFTEYFGDIELSSLQSALVRVSYIKNIKVEDLSDHFDQPTDFLFNCMRYIYTHDQNGEKEHIATYVLVIDENMDAADDYLF